MRLRQKLVDMADSVKGLFGAKKQQDSSVEKMERLKVRPPPLAVIPVTTLAVDEASSDPQ